MVDIIPANTSTFATIGPNSGIIYDTIETAGDLDWYKITLSGGTSYHINLVGDPTYGSRITDTFLYVYDSAGNQLRRDDDNGAGAMSYIDFYAPTSGTYYIGAGGYVSNTGDYLLSVLQEDVTSSHVTGSRGPLYAGTSLVGYIIPSGPGQPDIDTYNVFLRAGVTYTFTLVGEDGGINVRSDPLGALGNKSAKLFSSSDVQIGATHSGTGTVTFTAQVGSTGYYALEIAGSAGAGGYYSIAVDGSVPLQHRPSGTDATVTLTEDGSYSGFTYNSFGVTDVDGDTMEYLVITSLPTSGRLMFGNHDLAVGEKVFNFQVGGISYIAAPNVNGNGAASFGFAVVDDPSYSHFGMDASPNTITFNITPVNDAPVIVSGFGQASFAVDVGENATPVMQVQASDVDNVPTYGLAGTDAGFFNIDATTGLVTFRAAPDFETPRDAGGNNVYDITVLATDGQYTDTQTLQVFVRNSAGNTIAGTKGNNTVDASHAIDSKAATGEEDYIDGKKGNDKLSGLAGNDTLIGGKGNDTLTGGLGRDQLDGGKDADRFVFSSALDGTADVVVKFEHDKDRIALEDKIFKAIGSSLSSDEFFAKAGAVKGHDKSDRIVYNTTTGDLYFDKDGKGGAAAVHFAKLEGAPALTWDDFAIV